MSNILRRPMFRGGRVSSYGNGIASGLGYATGGRVGFKVGGISMSSIPKSIYTSIFGPKTTGPASVGAGAVNTATTTGGQLLEAVNRPMQGPGLSPQMQAIENRTNPKPRLVGIGSSTIGQRLSNLGGRFVGSFPSLSTTGLTAAAFAPVAGLAAANAPETIEELQVMQKYGPIDETFTEEMLQQYEAERAEARRTGTPLGTGETGLTSSSEELQKILDSQVKKPASDLVSTEPKSKELQQQTVDTEEKINLTAEEMIAANKELFRKELGYDQARRSDIGDLLGRISVAALKRPGRGETRNLGDIAGDVMAMELAAGPGRREKIDQSAAALAINDYIAGKRSKEQLDSILAKTKFGVDYQAEAAGRATAVSGGESQEDWLRDLRNVASRTRDKQITDTDVIRTTLFERFKLPVNIKAFNKKTLESIVNENAKDLSVGFNIVIAKDGKVIIEKKPNGQSRIRTDLPIT